MRKLTGKELGFAKDIIKGRTNSDAYRNNYSCGNMSNEAIASSAMRIIKRQHVKGYIDKVQKKALKKLEVTSENVLGELAKLAFSNIQNLFNENGYLIPVHELPSETAAAITEINVRQLPGELEIEEKRYKLSDKKASLELLGKHLGLWDKKPDEDEEEPESYTVNIIRTDASKPK